MGLTFLVPAAEERVIVATLQRMYRHFYFRVCDIVNTLALLEIGQLDFVELKKAADLGGIWPGVATYFKIVCDYVRRIPRRRARIAAGRYWRGAIRRRGRFSRAASFCAFRSCRNGADLYTRQVTDTRCEAMFPQLCRLSLLPYLASAAAVAFRITGSDKGIW